MFPGTRCSGWRPTYPPPRASLSGGGRGSTEPSTTRAAAIFRFDDDDVDSAARALFSQAFPYLSFAYAIILARTLLQVITHERVVHLVDLGSGDPKLWVPLLRSFARLSNGPPHLKVTCVSSNRTVLERLGHRLVKEAEILDLPFQFIPLNVAVQDLTPGLLEIRTGEALAFISILHLHTLLADDMIMMWFL
ncbi:unnamed protein product [Linum tenue]|uniref:Uncharacterized protein n=1 Tax=Linum tenue TaxID=586396 RepID=A0AAV0R6R0_9ROSI|nr:unnamed protein product [Linum tenue]